MNCKRVEELIPLYVGGDIDRRVTAEVQSHLKTCGGCAELAAEYEASRNWLSGASPELDEAMLTDVKRGVMRELRTASSRPGWFELMSAALARALSRPAVAAALLLVVFGALTLWLYLAKPAPPVQIQLTDGGYRIKMNRRDTSSRTAVLRALVIAIGSRSRVRTEASQVIPRAGKS